MMMMNVTSKVVAARRSFSSSVVNNSTTKAATTTTATTKLCWLDLRGLGLSMIERLSLEEALLRHDDRNWAIVGTHEPYPHKFLTSNDVKLPNYRIGHSSSSSHVDDDDGSSAAAAIRGGARRSRRQKKQEPSSDCMIVMGIGGKPTKLLNIPKVKEDNVIVIKRFSGGGTVVLDTHSVWTTLIGRNDDFPQVDPYPRSIMEWSANDIFQPTFERMSTTTADSGNNNNNNKNSNNIIIKNNKNTLVSDIKSCSPTENLGKLVQLKQPPKMQQHLSKGLPKFELRENDYVFFGDKKVGGNAQSIIKGGWLHHTSFLWDFDSTNMEYLQLPEKRPDYRLDRDHDDFLVRLSDYYGRSYQPFIAAMKQTCNDNYELENVTLRQVMDEVITTKLGNMNEWYATNRTRIIDDF